MTVRVGYEEETPERESAMDSIGVLQGVPPGRKIHHAGVLDFRRIPSEQIARIVYIGSADVLLLDEENRLALRGVKIHHVRSVLIASPDERVLVTPQLDLSRTAVASMPDGQRLLVIGNVFIAPDVTADLIGQKFNAFRVIGTLTAGAGALGALAGRSLFGSGMTIALPEDTGPITRVFGETRMTSDYLNELPDGTTYLNFGETEIRGRIELSLLREKIRAYYNMGETKGEEAALAVLRARCPMDTGEFKDR
jgi:hypothetical protein